MDLETSFGEGHENSKFVPVSRYFFSLMFVLQNALNNLIKNTGMTQSATAWDVSTWTLSGHTGHIADCICPHLIALVGLLRVLFSNSNWNEVNLDSICVALDKKKYAFKKSCGSLGASTPSFIRVARAGGQ